MSSLAVLTETMDDAQFTYEELVLKKCLGGFDHRASSSANTFEGNFELRASSVLGLLAVAVLSTRGLPTASARARVRSRARASFQEALGRARIVP